MISGVPQGTVLGPTLFLLYINDLPLQVSSSTTRLFADDCIVYREIDSPADAKLLQHDLDALQNWERTWLMSFNPNKCSVMSFRPCRNSHNIEYTIHETVLTRSKTYKYLGLHLSDDFKWTTHICRITKKAYQQLCFIRINTRNLPKSFRETAYKSLIRPHVEYCSSVWDPHTLSDTQKIERIQRQAARYVTGDYRRSSSVSEMLHNLTWTNLSTRRSVNRLTMIYKILNGHSAITPNNFFEFNKTQTRKEHNLTLRTYQPRGNIDKFAFVQRSIPAWNTLPNVIVQANSTEQVRVLLEKHLQQNPLPSLAF